MKGREDYIKNLRLSSIDVFTKILKDEKIEVVPNPDDSDEMELSATISLAGASSSILITIGSSEAGAAEFASRFLKSRTMLPPSLVKSSLSELVNIIAGDFKKRQMVSDLKLGLPQLIEGRGHKVLRINDSTSFYKIEYIFLNFTFKQFMQFSYSS